MKNNVHQLCHLLGSQIYAWDMPQPFLQLKCEEKGREAERWTLSPAMLQDNFRIVHKEFGDEYYFDAIFPAVINKNVRSFKADTADFLELSKTMSTLVVHAQVWYELKNIPKGEEIGEVIPHDLFKEEESENFEAYIESPEILEVVAFQGTKVLLRICGTLRLDEWADRE